MKLNFYRLDKSHPLIASSNEEISKPIELLNKNPSCLDTSINFWELLTSLSDCVMCCQSC